MSKKHEAVETAKAKVEQPAEEVYPVSEIIPLSQKLFGWMPECTAAALKPVSKDQMTLSEVKEIVEEFLRKEIK